MLVYAVAKPELSPLPMPNRFKTDVAYFMTPDDQEGVPSLAEGDYWIRLSEAKTWLDEGVFYLVSPLDSMNTTEVELSEDQERWLEWMIEHEIEHVRIAAEPSRGS